MVRMSKYQKIFAKGYTRNWSDEVFVIKVVKNIVSWTFMINDLNGKEIVGAFYENAKNKPRRIQDSKNNLEKK